MLNARKEPPEKHAASPAAAGYDANALAVGQAVLRATEAQDVILFGSRARGDYRADSDIDLLLVHANRWDDEVRDNAWLAAKSQIAAIYGDGMPLDLIWFTPQEFDRKRHSINSVVAIAMEEGFTMDGQSAGDKHSNDDDDYSGELDVTEQRCYHTRGHLVSMRTLIDNRRMRLMIGQHAHQAIEHALKSLISATGRRYPHHHELFDLESMARRFDRGFTVPLESPLKALNDYGGRLRYDGPYEPLGDLNELYRRVEGDVGRIFRRVAALTGKDPWREWGDD